ncbi:hypothetical protein AAG906_016238 [Vitis piasezkii]
MSFSIEGEVNQTETVTDTLEVQDQPVSSVEKSVSIPSAVDEKSNFSKSFEVPRLAKPATKLKLPHQNMQLALTKLQCHLQACEMSYLGTKQLMCFLLAMGNTANRSIRMHQSDVLDDHSFQNGDSLLLVLDVLVDDDIRDSDYYHDEDQFGGDGRNLNSVNEFDIGQSSDYNSMADMDREMFRDPHGYDPMSACMGSMLGIIAGLHQRGS